LSLFTPMRGRVRGGSQGLFLAYSYLARSSLRSAPGAGARKGREMVDIVIKRVYDAREPSDGYRVLVDRLWPRGLTKERVGADLWFKAIAPSAETRLLCGHDPAKRDAARWAEFVARYRAELDSKPEDVAALLERARASRLTLLFASRDLEFNQAAALRDYLREKASPPGA